MALLILNGYHTSIKSYMCTWYETKLKYRKWKKPCCIFKWNEKSTWKFCALLHEDLMLMMDSWRNKYILLVSMYVATFSDVSFSMFLCFRVLRSRSGLQAPGWDSRPRSGFRIRGFWDCYRDSRPGFQHCTVVALICL